MGPRNNSVAVVRVVYREGFGAAHEADIAAGEGIGVDEHYVMPGYGNLDNERLASLLTAFRARYGG